MIKTATMLSALLGEYSAKPLNINPDHFPLSVHRNGEHLVAEGRENTWTFRFPEAIEATLLNNEYKAVTGKDLPEELQRDIKRSMDAAIATCAFYEMSCIWEKYRVSDPDHVLKNLREDFTMTLEREKRQGYSKQYPYHPGIYEHPVLGTLGSTIQMTRKQAEHLTEIGIASYLLSLLREKPFYQSDPTRKAEYENIQLLCDQWYWYMEKPSDSLVFLLHLSPYLDELVNAWSMEQTKEQTEEQTKDHAALSSDDLQDLTDEERITEEQGMSKE